MPLVDPALVKKHLRVLHDDDDAEIQAYQAAAESIIVEYLDRSVLESGSNVPAPGDDGYEQYTIIITPAITAAILLLVGELYEHRESGAASFEAPVLPPAVRALLAPWRVWRSLDSGN